MFIDTREKLSVGLFPDAVFVPLEVGDIKTERGIYEIKIEEDIQKWDHLLDQLNRLSLVDEFPIHLIYISRSSKLFPKLVEECTPRGIYPHYLKNLESLPGFIKKLENEKTFTVKANRKRIKTPDLKVKMLYAIPGMTAQLAEEVAKISFREITEEKLKEIKKLKNGDLPAPFRKLLEALK